MAATIEIRSFHGATPDAGTDIATGSIKFKTLDDDANDATGPLSIPLSGTTYSSIKQFRFYSSTAPSGTVNNLKVYTDGTNGLGTGVGLGIKTFARQEGTATSGTTTVLTKTAATFPTTGTGLIGYVLEITAGTQFGNARLITANTATTITVTTPFAGALDSTSVFRVWYIDPITNAQTALPSTTDFFLNTSIAPFAVAGSLTGVLTGVFGDGIYLQLSVASTAVAGTTPSEVLTFSYDEA